MYLIAGLGNPGRDYVNTRHNLGFEVVSALSSYYDIPLKKIKHKALIGEGKIKGVPVILAQPQTYMNNSGEAIRAIMDYYKIPISNLIVIFDEAALPVGKIRIRPHGSAGGHNGMKSILYHTKSEDFIRIRLGIGTSKGDMVNHVLGHFSKEETETLIECVKKIPEIIGLMVEGKLDEAMNRYNRAEGDK